MATVYLPLGYPILQGQEFEAIVYQGTYVRKYVLPTDPRTSSQAFNRKLFSDLSRSLPYFGPFFKGFLTCLYGQRRALLLRQLLQSDLNSFRSSRIAQFGSFTTPQKDTLRANAVLQSTFNDPGMISWVIYATAWDWYQSTGLIWGNPREPTAANIGNIISLWSESIEYALDQGAIQPGSFQSDTLFPKTGSWQSVSWAYADGGSYSLSTSYPASVQFYSYGRYFKIVLIGTPTTSYIRFYVDGSFHSTFNTYQTSETAMPLTLGPFSYGLHSIQIHALEANGRNKIAFDGGFIARYKTEL